MNIFTRRHLHQKIAIVPIGTVIKNDYLVKIAFGQIMECELRVTITLSTIYHAADSPQSKKSGPFTYY